MKIFFYKDISSKNPKIKTAKGFLGDSSFVCGVKLTALHCIEVNGRKTKIPASEKNTLFLTPKQIENLEFMYDTEKNVIPKKIMDMVSGK